MDQLATQLPWAKVSVPLTMGVLDTRELGLGKKGDETFVLCASYVFQNVI